MPDWVYPMPIWAFSVPKLNFCFCLSIPKWMLRMNHSGIRKTHSGMILTFALLFSAWKTKNVMNVGASSYGSKRISIDGKQLKMKKRNESWPKVVDTNRIVDTWKITGLVRYLSWKTSHIGRGSDLFRIAFSAFCSRVVCSIESKNKTLPFKGMCLCRLGEGGRTPYLLCRTGFHILDVSSLAVATRCSSLSSSVCWCTSLNARLQRHRAWEEWKRWSRRRGSRRSFNKPRVAPEINYVWSIRRGVTAPITTPSIFRAPSASMENIVEIGQVLTRICYRNQRSSHSKYVLAGEWEWGLGWRGIV